MEQTTQWQRDGAAYAESSRLKVCTGVSVLPNCGDGWKPRVTARQGPIRPPMQASRLPGPWLRRCRRGGGLVEELPLASPGVHPLSGPPPASPPSHFPASTAPLLEK
nr:hypothetical protein Ade03nite_34000 [Actinoplanes derwentensis]